MNRFLVTYMWEICDLSSVQNVDMSVAPDMFCQNLVDYNEMRGIPYDGAEVDYSALAPLWAEMSPEDQADAKTTFRKVWRENFDVLTKARRENDQATFEKCAFEAIVDTGVVEPDYVLFRGAFQCFDDAMKNNITITEARDNYIAKLEEEDNTIKDARTWKAYPDSMKATEKNWYDAHVVTYDKGLIYAYKTNDRPMFRAILSTR